jgi:hypothetical protein
MTIHYHQIPATFINIPKTGTTSLKKWSLQHIKNCEVVTDPLNEKHLYALSFDEIKQRWGNFGTTFTFVRNPFSRLVSMFHHIGQDAEYRIGIRRQGLDRHSTKSTPIESDIKILSIYKKGFESWIINNHFQESECSLLHALYNIKNDKQINCLSNKIPDIVIKLEEIDNKFYKVQELLNCYEPMLHLNISEHRPYQEYYNSTTQKIVTEWFKEDLETFNYEF